LRLWGGVIWRNDTAATNGQLLIVASIQKHPEFSGFDPGVPNNLAIITLLSPADVSGPNLKNAILPPDDTNPFDHNSCWVSGYGRTDEEFRYSQSLQWRQMNSMDNEECKQRFSGVFRADVLPTHLCVMSDPPEHGPCNGDSGSPLHCNPSVTDSSVMYQAALMSWNAAVGGQCNLQYPSVATRLSKYLAWIHASTP
jgi:elastase-2